MALERHVTLGRLMAHMLRRQYYQDRVKAADTADPPCPSDYSE
jgi:hypothetical protein